MKRKGFTLVELLVVIAIIAMLMGILMPALARVRQIAYRMVCGTNLSAIGRAIMLYSNDYDEEYPRAGARSDDARAWASTGVLEEWYNTDPENAIGEGVTITSSFYLLVKYADVTPKQFVCKSDVGTKIFKLSDFSEATASGVELEEVQDFGNFPAQCCSYSYHMPYNLDADGAPGYPIGVSSDPGSPLCADRNPYLDRNAEVYLTMNTDSAEGDVAPFWDGVHYADPDKTGNAAAHQQDGQNVLFNDSHVTFSKNPIVGIENDNIWKHWTTADPEPDEEQGVSGAANVGIPAGIGLGGGGGPMSERDAYLVNEYIGDIENDLPLLK